MLDELAALFLTKFARRYGYPQILESPVDVMA
jgi:hypothetical protein